MKSGLSETKAFHMKINEHFVLSTELITKGNLVTVKRFC